MIKTKTEGKGRGRNRKSGASKGPINLLLWASQSPQYTHREQAAFRVASDTLKILDRIVVIEQPDGTAFTSWEIRPRLASKLTAAILCARRIAEE